jgi:hypothetical protein
MARALAGVEALPPAAMNGDWSTLPDSSRETKAAWSAALRSAAVNPMGVPRGGP